MIVSQPQTPREPARAIAALSESHEVLRVIVDTVTDAIFILDASGIIASVNERVLSMYGVSMDEVIGTSFIHGSPSISANPPQVLSEAWAKAIDGENQLFEWLARRPHDGSVFDAEIYLGKISLQGQDYVMATVRDISIRKQALRQLRRSEERFRAVFSSAGIGIALVNLQGYPVEANATLLRMLGYSMEEFLQQSVADFTHPDDATTDVQLYQTLVTGERDVYQIQKRYLCKDGSQRWGRLTVSAVRNEQHEMTYAVKMVEDITEWKATEDQLHLVAKVVENTIEGVTITDKHANIISVNPAFTEITGYTAAEATGENPRLLRSDRHGPEFYRAMWQSLLTTGQWQGEIWNRRKTGEAYPEWLTISAIHDDYGDVTHYVAVFHDITETKQNEEQIKYQANHDALTGLPNRQLLNDRLMLSLAHAQRNGEQLAICFLDLDRFKIINDTLGHFAGDRLLQAVAERLTATVRSDDTVARLGGDEFTILLTDITQPEDAIPVARKILNVFQQPFLIDGRELFTTPSIGISIYPMDGDDPQSLMKNADAALYRAKELGRNNYQLYAPAMNARAFEWLEMENALRRAIERQEFVLYYQPRVDAASHTVRSMEALIRWRHPERGLILPAEFIPLAEESGLIVPIGEWVLRAACVQAQQWLHAGHPPLRVAVNLSARQFQQETLVHTITEVLAATGLEPKYLELEITESVAMQQVKKSIAMLRELYALGIHLSIDDFGTGYSSLAYLSKLPVHALKIDQSFMRDIPHDQDNVAIATAVITLAHTMGLQVIAEGVETEAQLAFLRAHQCDEIQGYLFGRPVPAEEFVNAHMLHGG